MYPIVLFLLLLPADARDATVEREQLARLLAASWSGIRDIEFVFEGNIAPTDRGPRPDLLRPGKMTNPDDKSFHYQGTFAYRRDESLHLDNYVQNVDRNRPLSHQTTNLFRGSIGKFNRVPDRGLSAVPTSISKGSIMSMDRPMCPIRILPYTIIDGLIKSPYYHYHFRKWEDVSGRRTLVIDLDSGSAHPENEAALQRYRYWLDMDRDAMPVKVENYVGLNLRGRTTIELARVPSRDGKHFWLPIRGTDQSFLIGMGRYAKTPVVEETYAVLDGTIRVNQGLPDSRFQLDYEPKPLSKGLVESKATFDRIADGRKAQTAQERIDRVITKAESQSEILEASVPSRRSWASRNLIALSCAGVGLATLGLAGWMRRKGA